MDNRKKAILINVLVVLACILLAGFIYLKTGQIVIAIFFAPPIVYWILERKLQQKSD
jgi:hypothetical protein